MKRPALFLLALALLAALPGHAYRVRTHETITSAAVGNSQIPARIPDLAASLGIVDMGGTFSDGFAYIFGIYIFERRVTVLDLMRRGVVDEDDRCCLRYINHFFDPESPGSEGYLHGVGIPSRNWGLDKSILNDFSAREAKEYYRLGVKGESDALRKRNLALLFRSVGHVGHLIQDLGQPQHARNDSHILGSSYENFAYQNPGFLGLGSPPAPVRLPRPDDYWATTDFKGLANYSNRGFVTAGTNFRGRRNGNALVVERNPNYASPDGSGVVVTKHQITDLVGQPGPDQPLIGEVWFVTKLVPDAQAGSPGDRPRRLSTFSIFDNDLGAMGFDWDFTLNRFNFIDTADLLGGHAAAYSSGYYDYFFRGKVTILPPDSGLYSWADHATAQGFPSVRVKIRNDTPGNAMNGGKVTMLAKFHRNPCYKTDLTGEFTNDGGVLLPPAGCAKPKDYRTDEEFMLVANETPFVSLATGASVEHTFNFLSPIPMDATDVFLQVLYEGPLGGETDGLAVGTRDISEPTFVALFNGTDVYDIPGGFYPGEEIVAKIAQAPWSAIDRNGNGVYDPGFDHDPFGGDIRYDLIFPNNRHVATFTAVPKGRFSRIALLMDTVTMPYTVNAVGAGFNQTSTFNAVPKRNQINPATGGYVVGSAHLARETRQWNSVIFYRFRPPTPSTDFDLFPKSTVVGPEATQPVTATMDELP